MPNSYKSHLANGSTVDFGFSEIDGWLNSSFLKVYVNDVLQTTGYSFQNLNTASPFVRFTTAPEANVTVRIQRETPSTVSGFQGNVVNFNNGSILTETDLDNMATGLLHITQEAEDTGSGALGPTVDFVDWDAKNKKITNLGTPTNTLDAATKGYVDGISLYGTAVSTPQSWTFSGTGAQVSFTLNPPAASTTAEMFLVEVDGVIQRPTVNYTIPSVNTITFSGAPGTGTNNIVIRNFGAVRNVLSFNQPMSFASDVTVDTSTLHVDATNNRVGIGTTTPQSNLNVHSSTTTGRIQLTNSDSGNTTNLDGLQLVYINTNGWLLNYENGPLIFGTNNSEKVRILADGKVGIGTQSPVSKLQVFEGTGAANYATFGAAANNLTVGYSGGDYSGIGYNLAFTATSGNHTYRGADRASLLQFKDGGFDFFGTSTTGSAGGVAPLTRLAIINSSGNMGIGTAAPASRLDVAGTITATGANVTGAVGVTGTVSVTGTLTAGGNTWPQCVQTHSTAATTYTISATGRANAVKIAALDTTITPRSTSSKILLSLSLSCDREYRGAFYLVRRIDGTGTEIASAPSAGNRSYGFMGMNYDVDQNSTITNIGRQYLDSPNTTSAVTYELWFYSTGTATPFYLNRTITDSDSGDYVRGTSQMILQEYFA